MHWFSGWPTQDAGEAKVAELDDSGFGEQDVLRLYITVDALQHKHKHSLQSLRLKSLLLWRSEPKQSHSLLIMVCIYLYFCWKSYSSCSSFVVWDGANSWTVNSQKSFRQIFCWENSDSLTQAGFVMFWELVSNLTTLKWGYIQEFTLEAA